VLFHNREGCELRTALDVYNGPRVDSQGARLLLARLTEEKPPAIDHERLSGELLGLTCGCDRLRKEGVTENFSGRQSEQSRLSILRLGLSHLTVIRTHILFDHLLSSVELIIKANFELVNKYFVSEARP
jgi:hypothetical protein